VRARFAAQLARSALLADSRRLLVALSGGLDSVALLHLLRFGERSSEFELHAAHLDHAMRPGSAADAAWVRGLCRAWGVPLVSERVAAPPRGEAAARDVRYTFLHRAAGTVGADAILTAHHADDQAETVLFRLARGTGVAGLAGIPPRRGMVVRPLLPFSRDELCAYAAAAGLRWREDPTNVERRYARNRIRHDVLPALEAMQPGAARRIAALAERAAEAEAAWRSIVADALRHVALRAGAGEFELAREPLLGYHPHVRARVVRHLLRDLGCRPDRAGTRAVMEFISSGTSGGGISLAGARVEREFERITLRRAAEVAAAGDEQPLEIGAPVSGAGTVHVGGARRAVHWSPGTAGTPAGADAQSATFAVSALRFPLTLRGWRPGDRIRLPYGSKKLKKLFRERRIGRAARARVTVLQDAAGSVLWAVGVARSELAPARQEQQVFTITVLDGESL
jgi:tRNA(Ile)-lysidine synthase